MAHDEALQVRFSSTADSQVELEESRRAELRERIPTLRPAQAPRTVLDAGTGGARSPSRSRPSFTRWWASTACPRLLERPRARAGGFRTSAFRRGDVAGSRSTAGRSTSSAACECCTTFRRPELVVAELARVARPGGRVLVADRRIGRPARRPRAEPLRAGPRPVAHPDAGRRRPPPHVRGEQPGPAPRRGRPRDPRPRHLPRPGPLQRAGPGSGSGSGSRRRRLRRRDRLVSAETWLRVAGRKQARLPRRGGHRARRRQGRAAGRRCGRQAEGARSRGGKPARRLSGGPARARGSAG